MKNIICEVCLPDLRMLPNLWKSGPGTKTHFFWEKVFILLILFKIFFKTFPKKNCVFVTNPQKAFI